MQQRPRSTTTIGICPVQDWGWATDHALLQERMPDADPVWESDLSRQCLPWLTDHGMRDRFVFPAVGCLSVLLELGQILNDSDALADVEIGPSLVVRSGTRLRIALGRDGHFVASSRERGDHHWRDRANGSVVRSRVPRPAYLSFPDLQAGGLHEMAGAGEVYARLERQSGPGLRPIERKHSGRDEALAELRLPAAGSAPSQAISDPFYSLHPALVQGAFQALIHTRLLRQADRIADRPWTPARVSEIRCYGAMDQTGFAYCRLTEAGGEAIEGDVCLFTADGGLCGEILGIRCTRAQVLETVES